MSVLVDHHEDPLYDHYFSGMVPFQRGPFNQTDTSGPVLPDITIINGGLVPGFNNKQAGEVVGAIDATEEQLSREIPYVDKLTLMVRGIITPTENNECMCRSVDEEGHVRTGRVFHQNYVGLMAWFSRLEEMGVNVVILPNIKACAMYVIAMHNNIGKAEHHTFKRLLPTKQMLAEVDPVQRQWLLFLMSVPGIGEEAARGLGAEFDNMHELVQYLQNGGELSEFVLPSKRRVGKALAGKIRKFIGVPIGVPA